MRFKNRRSCATIRSGIYWAVISS